MPVKTALWVYLLSFPPSSPVSPSQENILEIIVIISFFSPICFPCCFTVGASKRRLGWLKTIHFNIIIFLPLSEPPRPSAWLSMASPICRRDNSVNNRRAALRFGGLSRQTDSVTYAVISMETQRSCRLSRVPPQLSWRTLPVCFVALIPDPTLRRPPPSPSFPAQLANLVLPFHSN